MDREGVLGAPGELKCKQCGVGLDANGGRPAERYAGTYTGLCYGCERSRSFDTGERLLSGAQVWSHPPHCPSWRRDREMFWWFPDCQNPRCRHGSVWVSRRSSQGGSYTENCPACFKRHCDHPDVVAKSAYDASVLSAQRQWSRRVDAEYAKRLADAGLDPHWWKGLDTGPYEEILRQLLSEAPQRPTTPDVPAFPQGWADFPKPKQKRKSR